ncbi:MAG: AlpA family phage regulatory protein [Alphaproteobacteria bacterium]|nr:AlpA family phage regulatory protein [Alphaproteobacteria bacterium]
MRIYRRRHIREIIPLSDEHIRRQERAGKFPRRFKLVPGSGRNGAVGWDADEVDMHVEELAAANSETASQTGNRTAESDNE